MTNFALLILVAFVGGVAISLQGQFMGLMDQELGTKESVFITYASGGLLVCLIMLAAGGGKLGNWRQVPWYALTTGGLGLIIVGTIAYTVPRLGLSTTLTVTVATQLAMAALVHHFGWLGATVRSMDWMRVAGIILLISGVWLMTRY